MALVLVPLFFSSCLKLGDRKQETIPDAGEEAGMVTCSPENVPEALALLDSARIYFDNGAYGLALPAYLGAYHLSPGVFLDEHFFAVGTLYFLDQNYRKAREFFEKSLETDKRSDAWERWVMEYSLLPLYRSPEEKPKAFKLCGDIEAREVKGLAGVYLYGQIGCVYQHYREASRAVEAFDVAIAAYKESDKEELSKPLFKDFKVVMADFLYCRALACSAMHDYAGERHDMVVAAKWGVERAQFYCEDRNIDWHNDPATL